MTAKSVGHGEGVPRALRHRCGDDRFRTGGCCKKATWQGSSSPAPDFPAAVAMAENLRLAPSAGGHSRHPGATPLDVLLELAVLDAAGRCFGEPLMNATKLLAPGTVLAASPRGALHSGAITSAKGLKLPSLGLVAAPVWPGPDQR